jgi:hypothetical protein
MTTVLYFLPSRGSVIVPYSHLSSFSVLHCLARFTELKVSGLEHPSSPAKPNIVGGVHFSSSSSQSSADEDFALEEEFLLDEDFALLLLDFELSFLLLLDTGSSESALLPLSSPQAARRNADTTHIAKNFFIQSSPKNKLKHLV